jgi:tetratricopeptide (TPR) repeat protein
MRRSIVLIVFVLAVAMRPASADSKDEFKRHFDQATAAFKDGRYDEALRELNVAYTIDPQAQLLYAIGQVLVMQGKCGDAITFYKRFLDANPEPVKAGKAQEAIDTCQKLLAEKAQSQPPPPPQQPPSPPPPPPQPERSPWYSDWLGDALVGVGVLAAGGSVVFITSARRDRERADKESGYDGYDAQVARAHTKQNVAIGLGGGAAVLIGAGVVRYILRADEERSTLGVSPTQHQRGAVVTWTTRF